MNGCDNCRYPYFGDGCDCQHDDDCDCDTCRERFDAVMWGWLDDATAARIQRAYESGDIPASMQ